MLSLDFFRSRVSISANILAPWFERRDTGKATITARIKIYNRPYAHIYDTEETLVLLLELLLVKDLNRQNALFVHFPVCVLASSEGISGEGDA